MKIQASVYVALLTLALSACNDSGQPNSSQSSPVEPSAIDLSKPSTIPTEVIAENTKPNFLIVMADDLGFTDIGVFGSEIKTPTIDNLANESLRFTQFYASPNCSPSRAMMMTGLDSHFTGFATMQDHLAENQRGQPGYEGYLPDKVVALSLIHI